MPGRKQPHRLRVIDPAGVLREEALLREDVQAGKQPESVVGHQGHHMALPFDRPELQGQRSPHGMTGGNHLRARQPGVLCYSVDVEPDQIRQEQKESAAGRREPARRQRKVPDVGHRLDRRPRTIRALFVQAPGQRGETLGLQYLADGRRTQGLLLLLEGFADLVDGVVALAQLDDQVPRGRLLRLRPWSPPWRDEEDGIGIPTEVVAQDVKSGHRVAEGAGHLLGGTPLDEIGAESLVLPLLRRSEVRGRSGECCLVH